MLRCRCVHAGTGCPVTRQSLCRLTAALGSKARRFLHTVTRCQHHARSNARWHALHQLGCGRALRAATQCSPHPVPAPAGHRQSQGDASWQIHSLAESCLPPSCSCRTTRHCHNGPLCVLPHCPTARCPLNCCCSGHNFAPEDALLEAGGVHPQQSCRCCCWQCRSACRAPEKAEQRRHSTALQSRSLWQAAG